MAAGIESGKLKECGIEKFEENVDITNTGSEIHTQPQAEGSKKCTHGRSFNLL